MPMVSTTWDPTDLVANTTIAADNLTWSATNGGDTNRARSVDTVSAGQYYWELTIQAVSSAYAITPGIRDGGPDTGGTVTTEVNFYSATPVTQAVGGVIGVLLDATAGTLEVRYNNATVTTLTGLTTSVGWKASVSAQDYGTNSVLANFGATPFAYAVPAGYQAGLGTTANGPSGFIATAFGTPYAPFPHVVPGIFATQFGGPIRLSSGRASPALRGTLFGAPGSEFDQTGGAKGRSNTRFGTPLSGIRSAATTGGATAGVAGTRFGSATARPAVTVQASSAGAPTFGDPRAGAGVLGTGFLATHTGSPSAGCRQRAAGFRATGVGAAHALRGQRVTGFYRTRFGRVAAASTSLHAVAGATTTQFADPTVVQTYRALHLAPATRFGDPVRRNIAC